MISPTRSTTKVIASSLAALLVLGLAACGEDPETTAARNGGAPISGEATFPVDIETSSGTVTVESRPERIVSLSPTATEMLFAIDAGDQVVAVDDQSNFPAEAPATDLSGFTPNVEAIVGYEPDLVVASNEIDGLADRLEALDTPFLVLPPAPDLDAMYGELEQLGTATGNTDEAADLVESIRDDIDELVAEVPDHDEPLTYYHELDTTYFTVTSSTFLGAVYALAGLENIADAADDGSGYPQLSPEQIISADPDFIFLGNAKCCDQSSSTVAARPGWAGLKAVTEGHVIALDDDIASRWGPRIVDLFADVVTAMKSDDDHGDASTDDTGDHGDESSSDDAGDRSGASSSGSSG